MTTYADFYAIGTHRSDEPSLVDRTQRIHVFPYGARYVRGISTPMQVGPSGHSWVGAEVRVSGASGYFELSGVVNGCGASDRTNT
jgi:hypothetical protein